MNRIEQNQYTPPINQEQNINNAFVPPRESDCLECLSCVPFLGYVASFFEYIASFFTSPTTTQSTQSSQQTQVAAFETLLSTPISEFPNGELFVEIDENTIESKSQIKEKCAENARKYNINLTEHQLLDIDENLAPFFENEHLLVFRLEGNLQGPQFFTIELPDVFTEIPTEFRVAKFRALETITSAWDPDTNSLKLTKMFSQEEAIPLIRSVGTCKEALENSDHFALTTKSEYSPETLSQTLEKAGDINAASNASTLQTFLSQIQPTSNITVSHKIEKIDPIDNEKVSSLIFEMQTDRAAIDLPLVSIPGFGVKGSMESNAFTLTLKKAIQS